MFAFKYNQNRSSKFTPLFRFEDVAAVDFGKVVYFGKVVDFGIAFDFGIAVEFSIAVDFDAVFFFGRRIVVELPTGGVVKSLAELNGEFSSVNAAGGFAGKSSGVAPNGFSPGVVFLSGFLVSVVFPSGSSGNTSNCAAAEWENKKTQATANVISTNLFFNMIDHRKNERDTNW